MPIESERHPQDEPARDRRGVRAPEIRSRPGRHAGGEVPTPVQVQTFLGGVDYPATKGSLLEQARTNHAPNDVIRALEQLPDAEYQRVVDVTREIGRLMPDTPKVAEGPSPAVVLSYLKGISFPATRESMIEMAERQNAPSHILDLLGRIAPGPYARVVDISKQIGKLR